MIKVFTKPNCPKCDMLKQKLDTMDIKYVSIDVTKDKDAYDFLISRGHKSVPQMYDENDLLIDINRIGATNF